MRIDQKTIPIVTVQLYSNEFCQTSYNARCTSMCTSTSVFFYFCYRRGLLFEDFGDAKTLVRWTRNHIGLLLSLRCWVTCQCPALDSFLDSFYSRGGVVSHLQGFPTFRVLASTRVPKYICRHKAEVSKRQYSSKAKNCNVHYFMSQWYSTVYLDTKTYGY